MPSVHRKGRKQFILRLNDEQRKILEDAAKAANAKDLSDFIIKAMMEKAQKEGVIK